MDTWLYVAYGLIFLLRVLVSILLSSAIVDNLCTRLIFAGMFVALFMWTIIGIKWYHESSDSELCATEDVAFIVTFWLIVCYTVNIIFLLIIIAQSS
jgi:hypothetical protein